jgi:hypothetical protein
VLVLILILIRPPPNISRDIDRFNTAGVLLREVVFAPNPAENSEQLSPKLMM